MIFDNRLSENLLQWINQPFNQLIVLARPITAQDAAADQLIQDGAQFGTNLVRKLEKNEILCQIRNISTY